VLRKRGCGRARTISYLRMSVGTCNGMTSDGPLDAAAVDVWTLSFGPEAASSSTTAPVDRITSARTGSAAWVVERVAVGPTSRVGDEALAHLADQITPCRAVRRVQVACSMTRSGESRLLHAAQLARDPEGRTSSRCSRHRLRWWTRPPLLANSRDRVHQIRYCLLPLRLCDEGASRGKVAPVVVERALESLPHRRME